MGKEYEIPKDIIEKLNLSEQDQKEIKALMKKAVLAGPDHPSIKNGCLIFSRPPKKARPDKSETEK